MKICLISNLFEPYVRGGAEKVAQTIALSLATEHDVFVITSMPYINRQSVIPHQEIIELANGKKIKIYRYFPLNIFYYLNDHRHNIFIRFIWNILDTFNLHSYFVIKKILATEKPNLIYGHNLKGLGLLIPRVAEKLKIKYLQTLHDVQYAVPSGLIIKNQENCFLTAGWPTKIYQKIVSHLLKNIKLLVSPSKWLLNYYLNLGFFPNSTSVVIPNPVDAQTKNIKTTKKPPYNHLLFIGQIEDHKGIEWLLENLPTKKFKITIIGTGNKLKKLQVKYQNQSNVIFRGYQDKKSLISFYQSADYLIVPSLCYENAPTVIAESLSFGLPVIATKIGGIPEMVGEAGFLFEANDPVDFASIINQAEQTKNYSDLVKNAEKQAQQYQIGNYLNRLEKISRLD